jgi:SAM-dependent methyltransferase
VSSDRPDGGDAAYNYFRLPLIRALLRVVYAIDGVIVSRVWSVRRVLDRLLIGFDRPFHVLDLGCGLADYLFLYAPAYPRARFTGVDNVEDNILVCRTYQRLRGLDNVTFIHDDRTVQTATAQDLILCITVLQYVDHLGPALHNIHDHLVDGGVFVLYQDIYRSGDEESAKPRVAYGLPSEPSRKYTAAQILTEVATAGFRVDRVRFCQGVLARHAEAMFKGGLNIAKRHPWTGWMLVSVALALSPLYLLVLWLDYVTPHASGGGILVVARRTAAAGL